MSERRRLLTTTALALGLGLLAACGSDDPTGSGSATTTAAATGDAADPAEPGEAALAYAECMREEGVEDFPDPEVSSDGGVMIGGADIGDDPDVAAAEEACGELLDAGGTFDAPDPERQAELEEQVLAFAECMREQGIDFPDPEVDGGRVQMQAGDGVDPGSPEFRAAQEACADEMPTPPVGGAPGAGGQP
jgi:hypothetical protein